MCEDILENLKSVPVGDYNAADLFQLPVDTTMYPTYTKVVRANVKCRFGLKDWLNAEGRG